MWLKLCFGLLASSDFSGESVAAIFRVTEIGSTVLADLPSNPEVEGIMPLQTIRLTNMQCNMATVTTNVPAGPTHFLLPVTYVPNRI
jgi:hypothetical protein